MFHIIQWEFKKIITKQHVILFVIAYLILHYFIISPNIEALGKFDNAGTKDYYFQYMEQVEGSITDKTQKYIDQKNAEIEKLRDQVGNAKKDYVDKKIDYQMYQHLMELNDSLVNESTVIGLIQNQCISQNSMKEPYRILYNQKSDKMLLEQDDDYLFIFFLIILSIATFFVDHDTEMDCIIDTTSLGKTYTRKSKLWILFFIVCGLSVLSELMTMWLIHVDIGALHFSYPIQSLQDFSSSNLFINIGQMYLIIFVMKTLGYYLIALFFSFLSNRIKKLSSLFGISIFAILLPPVLFSAKKGIYFFPLWGSTCPQNYLRDSINSGDIQVFSKFTSFEQCVVIIFAIILFVLFIRLLNNKRINVLTRIKKLSILIIVFALFGCMANRGDYTDAMQLYNFTPVTKDEINKNELYMPIVINNGRLQTYNTYHIDTNSMEGFDHDILHSFYDREIKFVVPVNGNVYYLRMKEHFNFSIIKRDKKTNHESEIYSENYYHEKSSNIVPFFNKLYNMKNSGDYPEAFLLDKENLFILRDSSIDQVNLRTHTKKKIIKDYYNVSIQGDNLYYTDAKSNMMKYDIVKGKTSFVFKKLVDDFQMTSAGMFFKNLDDEEKLYYYSIEDGSMKKVSDEKINRFSVFEQKLAYNDNKGVYILDLKTNEKFKIPDISNNATFKILNNQYILYKYPNKNNQYKAALYDYVKHKSYTIDGA